MCRYKANYEPSELLCRACLQWVPVSPELIAAFDHSEQRVDLCALSADCPKPRLVPLQHDPQAASDAGAVIGSDASAADTGTDHDDDDATAVLEVRDKMRVQMVGQVSSVAALLPRLTPRGQTMLGRLVNDMIEACGRAFAQRCLLVLD
jgi:hypothetical protein